MKYVFIRPEIACKMLKVTNETLKRWAGTGKIQFIKTPGSHRRYNIDGFLNLKNDFLKHTMISNQNSQINYCYARVSTTSQKEDLERQVIFFRDRYPNHRIVRDIGSGINFKRKGFKTILDEAIKGNIGEVVVTHKDRLCRFGFELIESIIESTSNGRIVVLNRQEKNPEQ